MKYLFILLLVILSGTSCKKSWLEIVPFRNQVAATTADYDKLMNSNEYYFYFTGGWGEAQLMGDEVAAEREFFVNVSPYRDRFFEWRDSIYTDATQSSFGLRNLLSQMYSLNKIINEVMESEGGSDIQKRSIRAEALATRAWANFELANNYCRPYNVANATDDPGFPKITVTDVTIMDYPRGTLQETYDFIISDLTEALVSIPQKSAIVTRMSKPAVQGILGKVYMYMGKYNEALPLLNDAVAGVIANGQTSLYDYNETFAPGGQFLPIDFISGPNGPGQNPNDLKEAVISKVWKNGSYGGNITGDNGLVLTPEAHALYGENDLRLLFYTDMNPDFTTNTAGRMRKNGVGYSRFGLQLPDLYLLRAECRARINDLNGAVDDLEFLRKHRIKTTNDQGDPIDDALVPAAISGNQNDLIKFIIDERIREFAMEGYRWYDMRRLSLDPLFANNVYTHKMYNEDGSATTYTLNSPNRFVLRFPREFTDANPGMTDNP